MALGTFLTEWTDIDVAAHELARCLGVVPERAAMRHAKWVHWSNNPLGNELALLLDRLTALGFLEKRDEPDYQYRIAPQFRSRLGIEEIWEQFARPPVALKLLVLRCADVVRSRQFYEALGIGFTPEQHGSGPQHYSAHLGEVVLELYPSTETVVPIRMGVSVVDVRAAVAAAAVTSAECVVRFDPEHTPHSALLRDPDGNKVELTLQTN